MISIKFHTDKKELEFFFFHLLNLRKNYEKIENTDWQFPPRRPQGSVTGGDEQSGVSPCRPRSRCPRARHSRPDWSGWSSLNSAETGYHGISFSYRQANMCVWALECWGLTFLSAKWNTGPWKRTRVCQCKDRGFNTQTVWGGLLPADAFKKFRRAVQMRRRPGSGVAKLRVAEAF